MSAMNICFGISFVLIAILLRMDDKEMKELDKRIVIIETQLKERNTQ